MLWGYGNKGTQGMKISGTLLRHGDLSIISSRRGVMVYHNVKGKLSSFLSYFESKFLQLFILCFKENNQGIVHCKGLYL